MTLDLPAATLVALLLAAVRAAAWLVVTPPLSSRSVPAVVKVALSVALALPVVGPLASTAPPLEAPAILVAAVLQAAVGLTLGFLTLVLMAAVQAAGDLIDLFGGFSLAQAYDPLNLTQSSVFGRLHGLLMIVLLFAVDGHLLLIRGFLASYQVIGLDGGISLGSVQKVLLNGIGMFFLAALQVAAPLIAASFLADLALGLLSKTAPSLNVFALGFPVKIGLTLLLVGLTLPLLPGVIEHLVGSSLDAMSTVLAGG